MLDCGSGAVEITMDVSPARSQSVWQSWRQSWAVGSAGPYGPGSGVIFHLSTAHVFLRQTSCFSLWLWNERLARAELVSVMETLLLSCIGSHGAVGKWGLSNASLEELSRPWGCCVQGWFSRRKEALCFI